MPNGSMRVWTRRSKLAAVCSLGVIAACQPEAPGIDVDPAVAGADAFSAQIAAFRQFPCDDRSSTALGTLTEVVTDSVQPNEMHDCQKLILPGGGYGPLVAIYPLRAAQANDPAVFDSAQPIASVFSWGTTEYPGLGIRPDLNCLWLKRDATQPTPWTAVMARPFGNTGCRTGALPDLPQGTALDVEVDSYTEVAATSRWGWGAVGNDSAHYIGIRCSRGQWCRIGADGFSPLAGIAGLTRMAADEGWHDEQRLAIPSGGGLVPGPWGRIRPAPGYENLDSLDFKAGRQEVAIVELSGSSAQILHYDTTWNMTAGQNMLSLWHKVTPAVDAWYLYVENAAGNVAAFEVGRETGVMHAVRGAVRWRWDVADESSWIGCDEACCSPRSAAKVFPLP